MPTLRKGISLHANTYHVAPLLAGARVKLPYQRTLIEQDDLHQTYKNLKEIKSLMKSWTRSNPNPSSDALD